VTAFEQEVNLLFEAAFEGDVPRLLSLLDADRSLVWDERGGLTALHLAAFAGKTEAADLILMKGADVNASRGEGTPLYQACLNGHAEVALLLLECGAAPDIATATGETPLHVAAGRGDQGIVRLLLEHGANSSLRDAEGRTALDRADRNGHAEVIALLSRARA
jgi:ankyrin repeat protein